MKKILIFLLAIILSLPLYSQDRGKDYGKFDFEIGLGALVATAAYPKNGGGGLRFEGRWQLAKQPIDVGFQFGIDVTVRKNSFNYAVVPVMAIADWQFCRGKKFNPYAGLGAGISTNVVVLSFDENRVKFALSPRIGIRCFKFLNLSA